MQNHRRLRDLNSRYGLRRPLEIISQRARRCDELGKLINLHMGHRMDNLKNRCRMTFEKLEMVSPRAVMMRGYSYVRDVGSRPVKSYKQVAIDDKLEIIFFEGGVESRVTRLRPDISSGKNDS
jgi:exonuclease VII large subunit